MHLVSRADRFVSMCEYGDFCPFATVVSAINAEPAGEYTLITCDAALVSKVCGGNEVVKDGVPNIASSADIS